MTGPIFVKKRIRCECALANRLQKQIVQLRTSTIRNTASLKMKAAFRTHGAGRSGPLLTGNVTTIVQGITRCFVGQTERELGRYLNPRRARFTRDCDINRASVASTGRVTQTLVFFVCIPHIHSNMHATVCSFVQS